MQTINVNIKHCSIGRLETKLISDYYNDIGISDTKVEIDGKTLCWVDGKQREEFIKELNKVINKYQI